MRGHHNPLCWAGTVLIAVAYGHVILELVVAILGIAVAVRVMVSPAPSMLIRQVRHRRRADGRGVPDVLPMEHVAPAPQAGREGEPEKAGRR